jgi:hypothetical protein
MPGRCGLALFLLIAMARPKIPESRQNRNRRVVYLDDDYDQLIRIIAARKGMAPGVLARSLLISKLDL